MTAEELAAILGPETVRSDYAPKRAIFMTSPSDVTLSTPENKAMGILPILIVKAIIPPTTDWAIYNVQTKEFRGFQLGDPVRKPARTSVELYADDDSLVELNFGHKIGESNVGIA